MANYELDQVIPLDGDKWRVTVVTDTFYIVTRASVEGEPESADDIKQVPR